MGLDTILMVRDRGQEPPVLQGTAIMDRNTAPTAPLSPKSTNTPSGVIYRNPDRETLGELIAEHCRLHVLASGDDFVVSSFPMVDSGCLTIGTYVDRDCSGEPAAKVFPYRLGNEAVAVEKAGGGKVAFADLPLALRLVLRPKKERETHVVTVRAHGASRNCKVTASASGLHFYRDFDDRPGKWHLEGGAPGVVAADWRAALQRHVCHG